MRPVIIVAILISALLTKCQAQAQTLNNYNRPSLVRIGIIDPGYGAFDFDYAGKPLKLCNNGHYDYSTKRATVGAVHPHGTIVGSIIANELKDIDYCAVIYNVWNHHANKINKTALIDAINRAAKENNESRCFVDSGTYPDRSSRDDIVKNGDGSVDLYFGPTPPAGKPTQNWIKTVPKKGWFTYFRLYGPTQPYFDRTWVLPDIQPMS